MEVFSPGQRLAGRYLLVELVGSGGMSHVWRAIDEVLGRAVAVKTLDAALHADPHMRATIRREARAAASIADPRVTQMYDFGEEPLPDGGVAPYLVMELLVGHNLADRLGRGPLPWPEAVTVCADVADALSAAHRLGVIHRDIKPANVMLTETGAKVVDFGIAAVAAGSDDDDQAPRAGTPAYLAPEVVAGGPGTPESDVYALGAVLHTALTGATPLAIQTWEQATLAHERGARPAPILLTDLPHEIRELVARCLADTPWTRPTSDEARETLHRWATPANHLGPSGLLGSPGLPVSPAYGFPGRPVSPPYGSGRPVSPAYGGVRRPASGGPRGVASVPASSKVPADPWAPDQADVREPVHGPAASVAIVASGPSISSGASHASDPASDAAGVPVASAASDSAVASPASRASLASPASRASDATGAAIASGGSAASRASAASAAVVMPSTVSTEGIGSAASDVGASAAGVPGLTTGIATSPKRMNGASVPGRGAGAPMSGPRQAQARALDGSASEASPVDVPVAGTPAVNAHGSDAPDSDSRDSDSRGSDARGSDARDSDGLVSYGRREDAGVAGAAFAEHPSAAVASPTSSNASGSGAVASVSPMTLAASGEPESGAAATASDSAVPHLQASGPHRRTQSASSTSAAAASVSPAPGSAGPRSSGSDPLTSGSDGSTATAPASGSGTSRAAAPGPSVSAFTAPEFPAHESTAREATSFGSPTTARTTFGSGFGGGNETTVANYAAGRHRVEGPADNAATSRAPMIRSGADSGGHPTLLDAAAAAWPAPSSVPAQPAPRSRGRRRRSGLAMIGAGLAILGILFISVAAGILTPADFRLGGGGGDSPTQEAPPPAGPAVLTPPSPTPDDPSTPTAAMTAIETEVASALSKGRINIRAATDLSSDLRAIRERFNRQSDIQRSGQVFQQKIDSQVGDGDLDVSVGAELSRLMDILMRLSPSHDQAG